MATPRARKKRKIMWRNRHSGETGFVAVIKTTKGFFENTADINAARTFRSDGECLRAIDELNSMGEGKNNDFIVTDETGNEIAI